MSVDWNAEIVDQVESHWRQQLRPRLNGLTDDEYFWQPVPDCWTISRRGQSSAPISFGTGEFTMDYGQPPHDPEPVTTMAWRLAHLIAGFAETNASHFGGPPADVGPMVAPQRQCDRTRPQNSTKSQNERLTSRQDAIVPRLWF